jgi:formiminoglutamate deiminase
MTRFWCELAWLGATDGSVAEGVLVSVTGDRITSVASGVAVSPPDATTLRGLTLPGMANAHSHAFHRGMRGRTHGGTGSFWSWREQMYALAGRLDPDSYRQLATATFAEMALAGFTVVGEFHYLHHDPSGRGYAEPNAMGAALVDAAHAVGLRLTLVDTCYLRGGITDAGSDVALSDVQRRFSDADVAAWQSRVEQLDDDSTTRIAAAAHSIRAVDPASLAGVAEWSTTRRVPLHVHVSEQPAENEQCLAAYGCTPVELLHSCGALTDRTTAVHATHLSTNDITLMSSSGAMCCMCPTTERDLADGIGPTGAFRSNDIAMCIGSDSHAVIDPFEETRAIELDERLGSLVRGTHQPAELMRIATAEGYRSLGWSDGGRIEQGSLADFTTVSFDSPRLAGSAPTEALAAVLFAGSAPDVRNVVVGGRTIVADGRHVALDTVDLLRTSIAAVWS